MRIMKETAPILAWIISSITMLILVAGMHQQAFAENPGDITFRGETLFPEYTTDVTLNRSHSGWAGDIYNKNDESSITSYNYGDDEKFIPEEEDQEVDNIGFSVELPGSSPGNDAMQGPYNMQGREGSGIWLLATLSATLMLTGALILANQYRGGGESSAETELPEPPGRP